MYKVVRGIVYFKVIMPNVIDFLFVPTYSKLRNTQLVRDATSTKCGFVERLFQHK